MSEPNVFLAVVYFDGVCNLCNASVDFLISRDRHRRLRFASLQSDAGQNMLRRNRLPSDAFDTFLLEKNGSVFTRSTAAIYTLAMLGGIFKFTRVFLLVPRPLRDVIYSWVARNRYRWFGKKETCRLPTPEERALFLS
jgi:predicted DCC family thiol-disulfide oxidoreductase YuxK